MTCDLRFAILHLPFDFYVGHEIFIIFVILMEHHSTIKDTGLTNRIVRELKPLGIERVILFGSFAYGSPTVDSDIDLLVVTSDDFIPRSFSEKKAIILRVNNALSFIRDSYPLDIIVHTRPMYQAFLLLDSAFQREISSKGIVLYEKDN